jgi:hypothetical protein
VGLARLEVDGPDSLVALAPALPQLVALTHLSASISLTCPEGRAMDAGGVFSAGGTQLEAAPCLQELCPGLRSLHLAFATDNSAVYPCVDARLAQLLPDGVQQLTLHSSDRTVAVSCAWLTALTSLRTLSLDGMCAWHPDVLLDLPGLEELDLTRASCQLGSILCSPHEWANRVLHGAQQHMAKLVGLELCGHPFLPSSCTVPELITACSRLCMAQVAVLEPRDAALVPQLASISSLRHLWLSAAGATAGAVSALTSMSQLTCLHLNVNPAKVPRSTWAAVLPHLTQLRVLAVSEWLLLEGPEGGLAAELHLLSQLQCLYVAWSEGDWTPAGAGAQMTPHLQMLSACSSLRAVLCWSEAHHGVLAAQPLWEYVHEGRLHLSCWHKWALAAEEGRVVCPRPCPHLPGVWELQEVATGLGSN